MTRPGFFILAALVLTGLLAAPAEAKTHAAATTSAPISVMSPALDETVTDQSGAASYESSLDATASATTSASKAMKATSTAAPAPSTPAAGVVKSSDAKTGSAKAGEIEVSHATAAIRGSTVDVFLSVENSGKAPDALVDMETTLGGTASLVTKTDGKETESHVLVDLQPGKSASLEKGDKWLRFTGIDKTAKEGEAFPLVLHFRHAPNITVMVPVGSKSLFGGLFGGN